MEISECVAFCDRLLQPERFKDYCPNGLQVSGKSKINKLVTGVTASLELIEAAAHKGADLLLVHHGLFWQGDDYVLTGIRYQRVRSLVEHNMALLAYHLPLDAHPEIGNNAQLGNRLGIQVESIFDISANCPLGFIGSLSQAISSSQLIAQIAQTLGRNPLHIPGPQKKIKRIAWCTGAAQKYIEVAHKQGADAYVSGEISESTTHMARELGIHYFAAGHHATERYGVKALGDTLAKQFGLEHEFIDIDNPA